MMILNSIWGFTGLGVKDVVFRFSTAEKFSFSQNLKNHKIFRKNVKKVKNSIKNCFKILKSQSLSFLKSRSLTVDINIMYPEMQDLHTDGTSSNLPVGEPDKISKY